MCSHLFPVCLSSSLLCHLSHTLGASYLFLSLILTPRRLRLCSRLPNGLSSTLTSPSSSVSSLMCLTGSGALVVAVVTVQKHRR